MLVKVFANLREVCGGVSVEVFPKGNRVEDVLDDLIDQFPEIHNEIFTSEKKLRNFVHVYINGKNIIHLKDLDTEVIESDQIALFPPVAGG
ncbi:MAG: MoaD family protein [Bacillales bacterium]|jgi:molybdopterin synthase sulfur carrier subunit|nr:MoaD family protein [Bacillales bacterium]